MSGEPGTGDFNPAPQEDLKGKTEALIRWMGLENVPDAQALDPDNKIGLRGAYVLPDGSYRDPVPQSVIEAAQKELMGKGSFGEYVPPIDISLLKDQHIPRTEEVIRLRNGASERTSHVTDQHIPLFKEQVGAVAQYLSSLGVELPATAGKDFTLPQSTETNMLKTKTPNLKALFIRNADLSQVTEVNLVVFPAPK